MFFKRNPALKEFKQISKEYKNIYDERLRNETFEKLRNILETEREKLTNGIHVEVSEFSYDHGELTLPKTSFKLYFKINKTH